MRLVSLSTRYFALTMIAAALGSLPPIVIGRISGLAALAAFDRSNALLVTPVDRATAAASHVLFSYFSRTNGRGATQKNVFLVCLAAATLLGFPAAAVVGTNGDAIIWLALGGKWTNAIPFAAPLAVFIAVMPVLQVCVPVLNGRGRPEIEIAIIALTLGLFLVGAFAWSGGDALRIVWSLAGAYIFRVACLVAAARRMLAVDIAEIAAAMLPGLAAAAVTLAIDGALAAALFPRATALRLMTAAVLAAAAVLVAWRVSRLFPNGVMHRLGPGAEEGGAVR